VCGFEQIDSRLSVEYREPNLVALFAIGIFHQLYRHYHQHPPHPDTSIKRIACFNDLSATKSGSSPALDARSLCDHSARLDYSTPRSCIAMEARIANALKSLDEAIDTIGLDSQGAIEGTADDASGAKSHPSSQDGFAD